MSIGSTVCIGYILLDTVPFLIEITLGLLLASEFFIAWLLRDLQGTGTNWKFVLAFTICLVVSVLVNIFASPDKCNYGAQIAGDTLYVLCAMVSMIMMFTIRTQSLENYKRLPICFCQVGALFQFVFITGLWI